MQPSRITEIELLYRRHGPALLLFAAAMTGERSRAQDAVHQVFLKLLEDGDLRYVVAVKAYLFVCVRNAVLNDTKIRRHDVALEHEASWFDPPNRDYTGKLHLGRALSALPADQRRVT